MKKILLSLLALSCGLAVQAQIKALTETGEQVTLYEDGTWSYDDQSEVEPPKEVLLNPRVFRKSKDASFLMKSTRNDFGLWINPKVWSFSKDSSNPEAEYELQMKSGDLYGMMISEKIEIPLKTLRDVAVENARSAAPDIKVLTEEYRMVNDLKVLHLRMAGTIQGIRFSYYGYYYSNTSGTVQLLAFTSEGLMEDMLDECDKLLSGLVVIEE
jgi:hypothetical protein